MRLIALTVISLTLIPSVASAQSWQDWVKSNPTYGTPQIATPPTPPVPVAPAPVKTVPAKKTSPGSWTTSNKYPSVVKENYMIGCTSQAGKMSISTSQANAFCGCTLNRIEENYTIEQFLQIGESYAATGILPESVQKAALVPCLNALR
jgi:hypothetical protein